MSDIGNNIKNVRIQHGLSQQEFADMICVTQQAVGKWERGTGVPQLDRLKDITDNLSIPAESVLYDNNDVIYEIPIDITDDIKRRIIELKEKSLTTDLTYAEQIELSLTERSLDLKGGKWIIHLTCTEYEYNIYTAIRHIYPMYSVDDFSKIIQGASLYKIHNINNNH